MLRDLYLLRYVITPSCDHLLIAWGEEGGGNAVRGGTPHTQKKSSPITPRGLLFQICYMTCPVDSGYLGQEYEGRFWRSKSLSN